MAAALDVAGRIAEGLAAVDDIATYVSACRVRGYQHADLTLHSAQVRDWYATEDGLDLRLLDADCAELAAAARMADDALRSARSQADALAGAWAGRGGDAAVEFIRRHCRAAGTVADAARNTADATAKLRDELWGIVDRKVAATVSIDDRSQPARPGWLSAARSVTAGAEAGDDAGVVIDTQVKPFVDNDIRGEWVDAMRSAISAVTQAYRSAQDVAGANAGVRFELPGDLGPRYRPPAPAAEAFGGAPASAPNPPVVAAPPVRPSSAAALDDLWPGGAVPDLGSPADLLAPLPDPGPPPSPAPFPATQPPPAANPLDAWASPGSAPAVGGMPSGLPDPAGGGLAGLPGRLADALGGLWEPSGDPLPDPQVPPALGDEPVDGALDDPEQPAADELDEAADSKDPADSEDETDDPDDPEEPDATDDDCSGEPAEAPVAVEVPEPQEVPPAAVPAAEAVPGPVPASPTADGATPCEIAADELPQAGE